MATSKKSQPLLVFNPRGTTIFVEDLIIPLPDKMEQSMALLVFVAVFYGLHLKPKLKDKIVLEFMFHMMELPEAQSPTRKDLKGHINALHEIDFISDE